MDLNNCTSTMLLMLQMVLVFMPSEVSCEMCGALTVGDGGNRASLLMKTITAFTANCRNAVAATTVITSTTTIGTTSMAISTTGELGDLTWPVGFYGLPMPTAGCPTSSNIIWETGSRLHDNEDSNPSNYWLPSTGIHFFGPYSEKGIQQDFCMKTHNRLDEADRNWPQGKYCVFKYGQSCPKMMSSGFIYWDDEDSGNANKVQGTVPSGVYDQDTRIEYCCMTGGDISQPISLPTRDPFYLFPYNSKKCQGVQGMVATKERFRWDEQDEPDINRDKAGGAHPYLAFVHMDGAEDNIVHYCYYEAIDSSTK